MLERTAWYVLQVTVGKELEVKKQLESKGLTAVVPIETYSVRKGGQYTLQEQILFSGYVFVRMRYSWNKYFYMNGSKHILKILGGAKEPEPLGAEDIDFILSLTNYYKEPSVITFDDKGDYEIIEGALLELRNFITKIDRRKKRAIITRTLYGNPFDFTFPYTEQTQKEAAG